MTSPWEDFRKQTIEAGRKQPVGEIRRGAQRKDSGERGRDAKFLIISQISNRTGTHIRLTWEDTTASIFNRFTFQAVLADVNMDTPTCITALGNVLRLFSAVFEQKQV